MSGLYHKALEYIQAQRQLRLVRPDELEDDDGLDISPDAREKIYAQINEEVEKNRREILPGTFDDFHAKKRAWVLPLMLNIAALLLIVGGCWWLLEYFNRSETTIVTTRAGLQSAEGKLLEVLKEEAEQRLSEKEQAINNIQLRLEEMSQEREQLEANAEARIQSREAELLETMEKALSVERARLQTQGISETDLAERMATFQARQEQQFQSQLDGVREEAAAEIERQRETLDQLSSEYQRALGEAENEKTVLQEEMVKQRASLLAEFEQKEAALESDRLQALQELESMRAEQERERLVLDQILSFYDSVRINLSEGNLDTALQRLGELKGYLNQSDVMSLPGVRERRQVEVFLIDSLEELIDEQKEAESPDTVSLIRSAEMLAVATTLVDRGNAQYLDADYAGAQELYISALAKIPALDVGFKRLQEIEDRIAREQTSVIAGIIADANTAYVSGEYNRAVTLYGDALELLPAVSDEGTQILSQLTEAGFQLKRNQDLSTIKDLQGLVARQSADLERLAALQQELDTLNVQFSTAEVEIEALRSRSDASAEELARIPELEADITRLTGENQGLSRIPILEAEIEQLKSANSELAALRIEIDADEERQERIVFLETEIERLETEAASDAKRLLTMDDLLAEVERLSVFEEEARRIPELEKEIEWLSSFEPEYLRLLGVEDEIDGLNSELEELKARHAELEGDYLERQSLLLDLTSLRTKYLASTTFETPNDDPMALLEHLETKLLLKRIVDSEPVRSQYPDLYDKIEDYLEALLEEEQRDTRLATILSINLLIDNVLAGRPGTAAISSTFTDLKGRDALLELMDRLEKLLK